MLHRCPLDGLAFVEVDLSWIHNAVNGEAPYTQTPEMEGDVEMVHPTSHVCVPSNPYLLLRGVARFFHKVRGSKPRNPSRAEVVSEVLNVRKFREQLVEATTLLSSERAPLGKGCPLGILERSEPPRGP